jgi:hypothetical protein
MLEFIDDYTGGPSLATTLASELVSFLDKHLLSSDIFPVSYEDPSEDRLTGLYVADAAAPSLVPGPRPRYMNDDASLTPINKDEAWLSMTRAELIAAAAALVPDPSVRTVDRLIREAFIFAFRPGARIEIVDEENDSALHTRPIRGGGHVQVVS